MLTLAHDTYSSPAEGMPPLDIDRCIERVVAGHADAWTQLMAELHPLAIQLCRYRLHNRDSSSEDICLDVATKTLERLSKSSFAALGRYVETRKSYPSLTFKSWLRAVVGNVCIDHLRTLPGHRRGRASGQRHHQITTTVSLTGETAGRSDLQRHVEIRRVLEWLNDPEFPKNQREAISLWMCGHNAAEIASTLGLPAAVDATRLLRAGRQRLRRRFEER
jgi:DNA-directed RNA polymerase specialized sigma24 family protein